MLRSFIPVSLAVSTSKCATSFFVPGSKNLILLITKFTSLVAVDPIVSRNQSDPLLSHRISQNIPEGWVDPEVMKQATSIQSLISGPNAIDALSMEPLDMLQAPKSLQVLFVQTATDKDLFYLLACILLGGAAFLFYFRQRLY